MDYDIYCDESRQDLLTSPASITATNRFCCIGGLMLTTESRATLKAKIKELREQTQRIRGNEMGSCFRKQVEDLRRSNL